MEFVSLLFLLFNYLFSLDALPQIQLKQGLVDGKMMISESGHKYFAFFGIPYAMAPTGPLRFKPPVPYLAWSGILDASQYRNACPQFDASGQLIGSEDCLNLNVFSRSLPVANSIIEPQQLLPVMVYIHAESYENGDSSLYGSEKLLDQNIVLVTFNYRLGILGFLSTDDHNSIGNFGLYDQMLALKWIQENIINFGGDPNQVTLFGQGAGASSIMYHLMSESSSNLFHKAILQSGSNLCHWAIEHNPLDYARKLAGKVGCFGREAMSSSYSQQNKQYPTSIQDKIREILPINGVFRNRRTINRMDVDLTNQNNNNEQSIINRFTNKEIVDCLRHTSLNKLLKAQAEDKIFGEFPQRTAPTIHKDGLIKEEPFQTLKMNKLNKKPIIIGLNKDETAYFIPLLVGNHKLTLTYDYLEKNVIPRFVDATISFRNKSKVKIVSEIMYQYFSNVNWDNMTQIIQQFVSMSTDGAYANCIDETAKLYSRSNGPVYFYSYEFRGSNSMLDLLVNLQNEVKTQSNKQTINRASTLPWFEFDNNNIVCHGDELFSLFSLKTGNLKANTERDQFAQRRLIKLWTEFASTNFLMNKTSPLFYSPPYLDHFIDQHNHHNQMKNSMFLGPNALWPRYNEDENQYLVLSDHLRIQSNYRKVELDFWKFLFDSELLMERSAEQVDYSNLSNQKYAAFAYTMLTTTIFLMFVISILLALLWYYTRKTRSFNTSIKTSLPGLCKGAVY